VFDLTRLDNFTLQYIIPARKVRTVGEQEVLDPGGIWYFIVALISIYSHSNAETHHKLAPAILLHSIIILSRKWKVQGDV
jgi:hypothetical protein